MCSHAYGPVCVLSDDAGHHHVHAYAPVMLPSQYLPCGEPATSVPHVTLRPANHQWREGLGH